METPMEVAAFHANYESLKNCEELTSSDGLMLKTELPAVAETDHSLIHSNSS